MTVGDGEPRLFADPANIETERDSVAFNASDRSIGFFVDIEREDFEGIEAGDSFVVWAKTKQNFKTNLGVAPYASPSRGRMAPTLR